MSRKDFHEADDGAPSSLAQEFWEFICENKKWWMLPILLVLSAIAGLMLFAGTGAAPFIYTLF